MQVLVKIVKDSFNTDTTESLGVQVSKTDPRQVILSIGSRELTVSLKDLNFALSQPPTHNG